MICGCRFSCVSSCVFSNYMSDSTGPVERAQNQIREINQLLQLCTARTVFSILVTVRLCTVMPELLCLLVTPATVVFSIYRD